MASHRFSFLFFFFFFHVAEYFGDSSQYIGGILSMSTDTVQIGVVGCMCIVDESTHDFTIRRLTSHTSLSPSWRVHKKHSSIDEILEELCRRSRYFYDIAPMHNHRVTWHEHMRLIIFWSTHSVKAMSMLKWSSKFQQKLDSEGCVLQEN